MDTSFQDRVRERARQLWLEQGCPEGRSEAHWNQAQREVLAETEAATAPQLAEVCCADASCEVATPSEELAPVQPIACEAVIVAVPDKLPTRAASRGTPLLKVGSGECRYITSETYAPAICCGAPTHGGSWCTEHRARVFARAPAKPLSLGRLERR